jgi:hypothetical protein
MPINIKIIFKSRYIRPAYKLLLILKYKTLTTTVALMHVPGVNYSAWMTTTESVHTDATCTYRVNYETCVDACIIIEYARIEAILSCFQERWETGVVVDGWVCTSIKENSNTLIPVGQHWYVQGSVPLEVLQWMEYSLVLIFGQVL